MSITENKIKLENLKSADTKFAFLLGDTFEEHLLADETSFSYSLKKMLNFIERPAKLCIRYSSKSNIFMSHKVDGLEQDDLESYFNFNKDKILAHDLRDYSHELMYDGEFLYIHGIEKRIVDLTSDILKDYKLNDVFMTTFSSEIVSYKYNKKLDNCLLYRIDESSLEYCGLYNSAFILYDYVIFDNIIDTDGFDIKAKENKIIVDYFTTTIETIRKNYTSLSGATFDEFALGDPNALGIINQTLPGPITYKDIFEEGYF